MLTHSSSHLCGPVSSRRSLCHRFWRHESQNLALRPLPWPALNMTTSRFNKVAVMESKFVHSWCRGAAFSWFAFRLERQHGRRSSHVECLAAGVLRAVRDECYHGGSGRNWQQTPDRHMAGKNTKPDANDEPAKKAHPFIFLAMR